VPYIKKNKGWEIPESIATPEDVYMTRRGFLKSMGLTTAMLLTGCDNLFTSPVDRASRVPPPLPETPTSNLYPAKKNDRYVLDRPLTEEIVAARYNNFYEFSSRKENIWKLAERFETRPWQVEVTGLVERPRVYDIDDIVKMMDLEERLYRLRCVEAWSMAVPWTGFPMRDFIKRVNPLSSAKYVKMVTFLNREVAPGQRKIWLPWPYTEGLTMAEATNELTMLVSGIYVLPDEYDFWANVDPGVPHPRWSQKTERVIGTNERRPTIKYNGYGQFVAGLYND
jgi:sulfoxide reductase catalytic subunit YedY